MELEMIRFLTFLIVIAGLILYFYMTTRPRRREEAVFKNKPKRASAPKSSPFDDFWVQVYDTDSAEEARKIQAKFHDMNIQCFLYEQGKKDVYGNKLKHYGISVPRRNSEKAQEILAQIPL